MVLEECGKARLSKSKKGIVIERHDRIIIEWLVLSKKEMQELINGTRSWIRVSKMVGMGLKFEEE